MLNNAEKINPNSLSKIDRLKNLPREKAQISHESKLQTCHILTESLRDTDAETRKPFSPRTLVLRHVSYLRTRENPSTTQNYIFFDDHNLNSVSVPS